MTVHDAAPLVMPEAFTRRGVTFHRQGFAAAAKRARLVIAVSEFSADEVATHTAIPRDRIRVVPNGVDRRAGAPAEAVDGARRAYGDRRPSLRVLGRHLPAPQERAGAARRVHRALDPDAGAAPTRARRPAGLEARRRRRRGRRARSATACACSARSRREQLFPLFAGADLFAFPSRHEGFGIPVLEAMAQGTAVVCSDIPALREVAGDAARFVAPDDPTVGSHALTRAARRRRRARAARRRPGARGSSSYSWERCARETAAVYREALNG